MKTTCNTFLLLDIWPPSVGNCSDSILMYTETRRTLVEWALPVFSDPHGESEVTMTSQNYREPRSTFEWGEYTVQYTAAKTRNAMTSQCVFDVTVMRKSREEVVFYPFKSECFRVVCSSPVRPDPSPAQRSARLQRLERPTRSNLRRVLQRKLPPATDCRRHQRLRLRRHRNLVTRAVRRPPLRRFEN